MNKQQMTEQFMLLSHLLHTTSVPLPPNWKDWDREMAIIAEKIDNDRPDALESLVEFRERLCNHVDDEMMRRKAEKTNKLRQAAAELKQTSPLNN